MENLIDLKTQQELVGFFKRLDKEFPTAGKYKLALITSPREWEYLQILKEHVLEFGKGLQLPLGEQPEQMECPNCNQGFLFFASGSWTACTWCRRSLEETKDAREP